MQECLPSTFQPALQPYMGNNLSTDKPLCRPAPPISMVCQTKCNVFLPPKIIPAVYMESPRMGPNLPYKPTPPSRKTSHTRTSQSRKTSHPNVHLRAVKRAISVYLRTGKRAIRAYLRAVKRAHKVVKRAHKAAKRTHKAVKRATSVYLRATKRAIRVQRARLSFPL